MPCSDAMIEDVIVLDPEQTVQDAMDIYHDKNLRSLPVIDEKGDLVGLMGLRHVLLNLLPKSVTMQDGVRRLDFIMEASPGIAKRLKKTLPLKVSEVMDKNPIALEGDTSTWEAVRVMALHGSPIAVIEPGSRKFIGMISHQSLLAEMEHLMEEL